VQPDDRFFECPICFELPSVDVGAKKWVLNALQVS